MGNFILYGTVVGVEAWGWGWEPVVVRMEKLLTAGRRWCGWTGFLRALGRYVREHEEMMV
jgi:hypothetical protein